jgi:hypothetical protein
MGKFRPGIPDGFALDVPEPKPVSDLGDYLDEPGASPVRLVKKLPTAPATAEPLIPVPPEPIAAVPATSVARPEPSRPPAPTPASQWEPPPDPDPDPDPDPGPRYLKEKAPRREISMTPEALRMSDELLDLVRSATGQRDAKANELFHAAILLLYEARGELALHRVPRRGRWGTPTARAFPVALKNAFLEAVLARARKP